MNTLDEWATTASRALGLAAPSPDEQRMVLDVAREAAHSVVRPAAPLATFLLGVAVGRGGDLPPTAETIIKLAREFQSVADDPPAPA